MLRLIPSEFHNDNIIRTLEYWDISRCKGFDDMFSRFGRIANRDWQTDGQTSILRSIYQWR